MNPTTSAIPAPPGLVHDVTPPAVAKKAAAPAAIASPIKAEVVASIPVKQPGSVPANQAAYDVHAPNPVTSDSIAVLSSPPKTDKSDNDLERILKSVNRKVKASEEYERQQADRKRLPTVI